MKKMMLVAVLAVAGLVMTSANAGVVYNSMSDMLATQQEDRRTAVEAENLPQGIKTALNAEEYTGWTVVTAHHVEPAEKEAYYEISLEKVGEEDLKVVKMDADGKVKDREITPPSLP